jgi:2-oxoglutarate dehydrogenase complex dehydrogenase (E1) component-like enzyme
MFNRHKRAGRVAQVVEHLPSKREALSSDPSVAKIPQKLQLGNLQPFKVIACCDEKNEAD